MQRIHLVSIKNEAVLSCACAYYCWGQMDNSESNELK
jgi:hypothetical protein